ncbi:hypothetical protein NFI95_15090 [Acetobacteraceae bacterium KSS8]|uniref:Uncharacterized protein n=1 Tax=Endosaccharibacter trunci TaxID=2812733 RepID=A0ABT1WA55_9PROT|nr:hypothetical protein [Acetobacteraceae bacterium KSS8]
MAGFLSRFKRGGDQLVKGANAANAALEHDAEQGAPSLFQYDSRPGAAAIAASAESATVLADRFVLLPKAIEALGLLNDEWRVGRILHDFLPIVLVELHSTKSDAEDAIAYWVLDQDGSFIGNRMETLPRHVLARIGERMLPTLIARDEDPASFRRLIDRLATIDRFFRLKFLYHVFEASPVPVLSILGYGPDQDARFRIVDGDGGIAMMIDGVLEWPIGLNGDIAGSFRQGWFAADILTCFAPLLMLELRDQNGARSTWVLNAGLKRIDGEDLAESETIAVLRQVAPKMIRYHWRQILALADSEPGYVPPPMLRLNAVALHRMLHRVGDLVVPETVDQMIENPQPDIVLGPAPTYPHGLVLAGQHVRAAVNHGLYRAGLDAVRRRRFTWPSPVDGSEAELEAVIAPQENTIVYQFLDRNGLRFMVATGERDCVQMGLYLPYENRFLCDKEPANWWFRHSIPAEFWMLIYEHALLNIAAFPGRRRRGAVEIVNVFMAQPLLHIGHYVWNDLTGQAGLVRELGAEAPRSLVIEAPNGQAEFFGPLETLFPALDGKVDRSLATKQAFWQRVYGSDIVPIRFTRSYIDAELRTLVRRYVSGTDDDARVAEQRASHPGGPVLIVGIRLEDRTFVDSTAVYEALVDHLDRNYPGTAIVLDGRNLRPGGKPGEVFAGIQDHHAIRSPLEAERDLVARIRDYAAGTSIAVFDTVGRSIETSMAWCYRADLCFSPWGAGLAKYRWLANLPGVIPTSRFNLEQRSDLDIYHSERWMEAPAPLLMPDANAVIDRPEMRGNAPMESDNRGRECFEIDRPHLFGLLDRLLADLGYPARSSRQPSS